MTATITNFRELGIPRTLVSALETRGLTIPTPIQAATIADALAGRDVCGNAPTGSGKTLAFSLPLAMRATQAAPNRPTALVLVPTRELATQVQQAIDPLAQRMHRRVAAVYGGTPIGKDTQRLRRGVDILVACPGRLADLVRRGTCDLRDVAFVVLDEADRMADMGFLPEVTRLLDQTRSDRQTLLFSATLDGAVSKLVTRYQHDPARHDVVAAEDDLGEVRHLFFGAERADRRAMTERVLGTLAPAIVFTRTKHGADRLARQLDRAGIPSAAIHGDRSQRQRERALAQFRAGEVNTLVATDVAARGIHVDSVALVIQYDLPADPKDYVHRSGRTGRAGADGVVVSFVGTDESKALDTLQRVVGLPRGLHATDLALLTAHGIPTPTEHTSHSRDQGRGGAPRGPRTGPKANAGRRSNTHGRAPSGGRRRARRR